MPDVTLASAAGLELGDAGGVRCSAGLESSVPGIYAAGDICEYDSPIHGAPMRIEHWDVAFNQGKTAALNMLGRGVEHDVVPYFFSDLADWVSMEYVGPGSGDPVVRGSMDEHDFTAFYVDDGRVNGRPDGRPLRRPRARTPLPHRAHEGRPGRAGGPRDGPRLALAVSGARLGRDHLPELAVRAKEVRPVLGAEGWARARSSRRRTVRRRSREAPLLQMIQARDLIAPGPSTGGQGLEPR